MNALLHAFKAIDWDNPARVDPPDDIQVSGQGRHWSQLTDEEKRRTVRHYFLCHLKNRDGLGHLSDLVSELKPDELLNNFANGDDAANGDLVARLFRSIGKRIEDDEEYVL